MITERPDRRRRLQQHQHHPRQRDAEARAGVRPRRQGRGLAHLRVGGRGGPRREQRSLRRRHQRRHLAREPLLDRRPVGRQPRQGHARHRSCRPSSSRRSTSSPPATCRSTAAPPAACSTSSPSRARTSSTAGVQLLLAGRAGRASASWCSSRPSRSPTPPSSRYIGDIGFDLGGPIIKDKLWFYVGFDVSSTAYNIKRGIYRTADRGSMDPRRIETDADLLAELRRRCPHLQGMAKLTWSVNADNRLTLAAYGTPDLLGRRRQVRRPERDRRQVRHRSADRAPRVGRQRHLQLQRPPVRLHARSTPRSSGTRQFLDKKLLLDVMLGTHYQKDSMRAADGSTARSTTNGLGSLLQRQLAPQHADPATGRPNYHSITDFETLPRLRALQRGAGYDCLVVGLRQRRAPRPERGHLQPLPQLGDRQLPGQLPGPPPHQGRLRRRVHQLQEPEEQPRVRRVRGRQPVRRRGALRHPDRARPGHRSSTRCSKKTSSLTVGGFIQDSWSVIDKVTVNLGCPLRRPVLLQHRGQRRPVAAQPVVAAPGRHLRPHPERQVQGVRQLRPLLRERAARLRRRRPGGRAPGARRPRLQPAGLLSQQRNRVPGPGQPAAQRPGRPRGCPTRSSPRGGLPGTLDPDIEASSSDEISGGAEYEVFTDARVGLTLHPPLDQQLDRGHGAGGRPVRLRRQPRVTAWAPASPRSSATTTPSPCSWPRTSPQPGWPRPATPWRSLRGQLRRVCSPPRTATWAPTARPTSTAPTCPSTATARCKGDIRHTIKVLGAKDWQITPEPRPGHRPLVPGPLGRRRPATWPPTRTPTRRRATWSSAGTGPRLPWTFGADLQLAYRVAAWSGHRPVGDRRRLQPAQLAAPRGGRRGVHHRQRRRHRGLQPGDLAGPNPTRPCPAC